MRYFYLRVLPALALFLGALILIPRPSSALVGPNDKFDPRLIPIELQAWWTPNYGHIHAGTRLPLGQEVSGILRFDVRIVLHNNPGLLRALSVGDEDDNYFRSILDLACPYDGVHNNSCAFNVPVEIDTRDMQDGWRELRIRAQVDTPDGKDYFNSSGVPILVTNGGPRSDYDRFCNNTSLIGRGWYDGFDYTNAIIECVPLRPVSDIHTFFVRSQNDSDHLEVALDKTHLIPAVGPYPVQPASTGRILFDEDGKHDKFFPIAIDTRNLPDGWHSLAVTSTGSDGGTSSCGYCDFEFNHPAGSAKIWFFVDNGPVRFQDGFEQGSLGAWESATS